MFTTISFSICIITLFYTQIQVAPGSSLTTPLIAEITADHPLFLFTCNVQSTDEEKVKNQWDSLDNNLKPFSALWIDLGANTIIDPGKTEDLLTTIFQDFKCPFVLKIPQIMNKETCPEYQELESLFTRFPNMLGVSIHDFTLNMYPSQKYGITPDYAHVLWVSKLIQVLASYGRFLYWCMDSIEWAYFFTNPVGEPLFNIVKKYADYVIPSYRYNGDFSVIGLGEMLGLYTSNVVNRFGIVCNSSWYHESFIIEPCLLGKSPEGAISIHSPIYRAMILNGVLAGSVVYAIEDENALWGRKEQIHWDRAIQPTLRELITLNSIPPKNLVLQRVNTGLQLFPSTNPFDFQQNLKEIDPQRNEGKMIQIIYGDASHGKLPVIVPDNGSSYIIPILPSFLTKEETSFLPNIVGYRPSHPEWTWTQVLSNTSQPVGEGTAFITNIGKTIFVFNSNEYENTQQTFQITHLPAPVRKFSANRSAEGVVIKWPFREGDISYQVYRRFPPETSFQLLARGLDSREWKDTSVLPQQTVAYSITALTSEQEPFSGTANYGDYFIFSSVESRIVEEVVLAPETFVAESVPIIQSTNLLGGQATCKDPSDELELAQKEQVNVIKKAMELLESAFIGRNVDSIVNLFAPSYKDTSGRGVDYIRAGLELFLHQCQYPKIIWQVRRWLFITTPENQTQVKMALFLRMKGYKISDSMGIKGNIPIEILSGIDGETTFTWALQDNQWKIIQIEPTLFEIKQFNKYDIPASE
ncbi:MAG: hypothetical protein ACP5KS_04000 [Candidatus Hydrogenedens sp.]